MSTSNKLFTVLTNDEMSALFHHIGLSHVIGINPSRITSSNDNDGFQSLANGFQSLSQKKLAATRPVGDKQYITDVSSDLQEYMSIIGFPSAVVITQINNRILDLTTSIVHYWGVKNSPIMELLPFENEFLITRLQDNRVWQHRIQNACHFPSAQQKLSAVEHKISPRDIRQIELDQPTSILLPENLRNIIQKSKMSCTFSCVNLASEDRINYAVMWTEDAHCIFESSSDNLMYISQKSIPNLLETILETLRVYP